MIVYVEPNAAPLHGEAISDAANHPLLGPGTWFIEGQPNPVEERDLRRLHKQGVITADTRVWACAQPGWRKLDDVWEVPNDLRHHAIPNDCCGHSSLEFMPTIRGWLARRAARLRALRLRLFARCVYRQFYRQGLETYGPALLAPDAPPARRAVFVQWWRRAGLPMSVLTEGVTDKARSALEASDRAARYPGWFRALLAGVVTYDRAPWTKAWELAKALIIGEKPPERGPAGMTILASNAPELLLKGKVWQSKIWLPPGTSRQLKRASARRQNRGKRTTPR